MKRFAWIIILSLVFAVFVAGCAGRGTADRVGDENADLKIYTTFYPLYYFTQRIAGDKASVESLVPAGVEPHEYEPSMKQMGGIYDGDVFIFLGESMEPWAKKLQGNLEEKGISVLEAGEGIIAENDPHVWLDPLLAKEISQKIFAALAKADEQNADYYKQNYSALENQLEGLHGDFKSALSQSHRKDVVTSHAIFGYLARRYGLNQRAVAGLSPQEEPSLKKLMELTEIVKELGIKYIFTETLGSSKLSDSLAREAGISTLVFNPLESWTQKELDDGQDYFSVMRQNLEVLMTALAQ